MQIFTFRNNNFHSVIVWKQHWPCYATFSDNTSILGHGRSYLLLFNHKHEGSVDLFSVLKEITPPLCFSHNCKKLNDGFYFRAWSCFHSVMWTEAVSQTENLRWRIGLLVSCLAGKVTNVQHNTIQPSFFNSRSLVVLNRAG